MNPIHKPSIDRVRSAIAELIGIDGLMASEASGKFNIIHSDDLVATKRKFSPSMPLTPTFASVAESFIDPFDDFEGYFVAEQKAQRERIESIGNVDFIAIVRHKDISPDDAKFMRWLMILEDASTPGSWRTQAFDHNGFSGHMTFATKDQAIESAATQGFSIRDDDALDRVQDTPAFQRGLLANELIKKVNQGALTFAEANKKLGEYDAIQGSLTSVATSGAQAFVTGKEKNLYLIADRIKPGDEQGVFLHEVTHRWRKKAMEPSVWNELIDQLKAWEFKDVNSTENFIHKKSTNRVKKAQTSSAAYDDELFAYAVEEAVALGIKPSALAEPESAPAWLEKVSKSLKQVISASLTTAVSNDVSPSFLKEITPQDLVDMSYAMAQLDSPQRMNRILSSMSDEEKVSLKTLLKDVKDKGPGKNLFTEALPEINELNLYSELAFQLQKASMKQAPAEQWSSFIQGLTKKGVKQDEIEWSGVNDWLSLQSGKVSKEDVVSFVRNNGVQVIQSAIFNPKDRKETNDGLETAVSAGIPRYDAYVVPGGDNYREILLRVPDKRGLQYTKDNVIPVTSNEEEMYATQPDLFWYFKTPDNVFQIPKSMHSTQEAALSYIIESKQPPLPFDKNYKSKHFAQNNIVAHLRLDDRIDADGNKVLFVHEVQSDWGQDGKKKGFKNPKNELPPVPLTYQDIVLGDEVSGWGKVQAIRKASNGLDFDVGGLWVNQDKFSLSKVADRNVGQLSPGLNEERVAPGPFVSKTDGWLNLAIKRVVGIAAEEGHDRVVFISGEQATDLYDLSKQIEKVEWITRPVSEKGSNSIPPEEGILKAWDKKGKLYIDQSTSKDELPDLIGKDLAEKLTSTAVSHRSDYGHDVRSLEGLEIKVGGDGMHVFYDTIVPNAVKDVLRRLGTGNLDKFQVPSERHRGYDSYEIGQSFHGTPAVVGIKPDGESVVLMVNGDAQENLAKLQAGRIGREQVGFAVTDEMRLKVRDGIPMFSVAPDTNNFQKWSQDLPLVSDGSNDFEGGAAVFVAYHGSTFGDITEFKRQGNSEGYLGAGPYFSTSSLDAGMNYAGVGPDLTARISLEVENMGQSFDEDDCFAQEVLEAYFESKGLKIEVDDDNFESLKEEYSSDAIDFYAQDKLTGDNNGVVYPVFIRLSNPADTTGGGADLTYDVTYDDDGVVLDETGTLVDWIMAARNIASRFGFDVNSYVGTLLDDVGDDRVISMDRVFSITLKEVNHAYGFDGESLSAGAVFSEIAEDVGYDGVIMDADMHFGSGRRGFGGVTNSMPNVEKNTLHVLPFSSAQVKSFFNGGTFDLDSNDIRFSIAVDADQKKVVGQDGLPLTMYHGSPFANIGQFDTSQENNHGERGTFFSERKDVAMSYGDHLYSAQLTMEKPYEVNSKQWAMAEGLSPAEAKDAGHDGYIVRGMDGPNGDVAIVFDPKQINVQSVETAKKISDIEKAEKAIAFISESEQLHKKLKPH